MPYLRAALILNFFAVSLFQFLFSGSAHRIKERFTELGLPMLSRPESSLSVMSKFWTEARQLNSTQNDSEVSSILRSRYFFVAYTWASVLALAIAVANY